MTAPSPGPATARPGKPVLLAVDDDPQVQAAIRKDLRDRYAKDYRVVAAGGGPQAVSAVEELHRRGDEVALFLVDERMPDLTGTEFLLAAKPHYPEAKKVLLTAYADTDGAPSRVGRSSGSRCRYAHRPNCGSAWRPPRRRTASPRSRPAPRRRPR